HPRLIDAVSAGTQSSPTFRRIVEAIERSNVIVYVVFERPSRPGIAAHVAFISAARGRRYVHAALDPSLDGARLVSMLAHELQHAAEIAGDPAVVDDRTLAALYQRIGVDCGAGAFGREFDSSAAIDAGGRVLRELRDGFAQLPAGTGAGSGAGCSDVCR